MRRVILLIISIFSITIVGLSQEVSSPKLGWVSGRVQDENGDSLIFAKVFVDSTSYKSYSNKTGVFTLKLPVGEYRIKALSSTKELSAEESHVIIKEGDTTHLDFVLHLAAVQGHQIHIHIQTVKAAGDETKIEQEIQKSDVAISAISEKEVKTASNITNAAQKITGVSIVGGRYVYIRGLSDRYSKTIMNQSEIPGLDPNKNSVQLDLFPTAFISSMVVYKTYSPEYPADWGGGILDIRTKEFPMDAKKAKLELKLGTSYNTQSNLKSDALTYKGGKFDFLGFDDGTRSLPNYLQDLINQDSLILLEPLDLPNHKAAYDKSVRSFNKIMDPIKRVTPLNYNATLTLGNKKQWFKDGDSTSLKNRRTFGYFAGVSYNRSFSHFNNGTRSRYNLVSNVEGIDQLNKVRDLNWTRTQDNVTVGTFLNLKYLPNSKNTYGINLIRNHNGQEETSITEGFTAEDFDITFRNRQLGYLYRAQNTFQMYGENKLMKPDSVKSFSNHKLDRKSLNRSIFAKIFNPNFIESPYLDWTIAYTAARQDEPDLRYVTDDYANETSQERIYNFSPIYSAPARYFRYMQEYNLDHKINLTLPIEIDSAQTLEIKIGASNITKFRNFKEFRFDYNAKDSYNGNFESILSDDNIGYLNGYKIGLLNLTSKQNNYVGFSNVASGFLKVKVPITDKIDVLGGFRDEYTIIEVESEDTKLKKGSLVRNDILPSANINFTLLEQSVITKWDSTKKDQRLLKLRTGYNKTLARPNFRELAPYATEDYDLGFILIGNSNLDRTLIDNIDLKLEYFPRSLETFTIAGFYKKFQNPIELLTNINAGNEEFQWKQVPRADVFGIEIEAKKKLDFLSKNLEDLRIGGNVALIQSKIDIQANELATIRVTDPSHASTRPLFGQSPYLINAFIEFEADSAKFNDEFKTSSFAGFLTGAEFSIDYNVYGPRLATVTAGGTPDIYEMPFHNLNFNFSKKVSKKLSVNLKVTNILNSWVRQNYYFNSDLDIYKKFNDQQYSFSRNRNGVNFAFSATYKF